MSGFFDQLKAFNIMFLIMFCFVSVFSIIIFSFVIRAFLRYFRHQKQVDRMPQQSAHARVVTKRSRIWGEHSHTAYYATFEFDSRQRIELNLSGEQFGLLAEGDDGTLTYQGDRFVNFQRV